MQSTTEKVKTPRDLVMYKKMELANVPQYIFKKTLELEGFSDLDRMVRTNTFVDDEGSPLNYLVYPKEGVSSIHVNNMFMLLAKDMVVFGKDVTVANMDRLCADMKKEIDLDKQMPRLDALDRCEYFFVDCFYQHGVRKQDGYTYQYMVELAIRERYAKRMGTILFSDKNPNFLKNGFSEYMCRFVKDHYIHLAIGAPNVGR